MPFKLHEITPDQASNLRLRIVRFALRNRFSAIRRADIFLTEDCNLACDYCFVYGKQRYRRMSWETACKAIDFLIAESRDANEITITFFGGEPLLEFPLMKRAAEYAVQQASEVGKQVHFSVTTNGTVMNEDIILFARQYSFNYLLSIDGDKKSHDRHRKTPAGGGSWDLVMGDNFQLLKSLQGWVGVRITVCPDTVGRLSSGIRTLFEKGVNQFLLGYDLDADWSVPSLRLLALEMRKVANFYFTQKSSGAPIRITEFDETLEQRRDRLRGLWSCDAGRGRVAISTSGELYSCARFVSSYPDAENFKLGSLDSGITNLMVWFKLLSMGTDARPRCVACSYSDVCAGGCPAANLHTLGSISNPPLITCVLTREAYRILSTKYSAEQQANWRRSREGRFITAEGTL